MSSEDVWLLRPRFVAGQFETEKWPLNQLDRLFFERIGRRFRQHIPSGQYNPAQENGGGGGS